MDLSNLTFDELLDAIRSDSGYQNAQAKRTNKKNAIPEVTEVIAEEPAVCEPTQAEDTPEVIAKTAETVVEEPAVCEPTQAEDIPEVTAETAEAVVEEPAVCEHTQAEDTPEVIAKTAEAVVEEPAVCEPTQAEDIPEVTAETAEAVVEEPAVCEHTRVEDIPEVIAETAEAVVEEPAACEHTQVEDIPEVTAETAEAVVEEPASSDFEEVKGIFEEIVIENPIEITERPTVIISAAEETSAIDIHEVIEESDDTVIYEPTATVATEQETSKIFTPPATPLSLFETEQFEEEELPVWRMPDFTAEAYRPSVIKESEPVNEPVEVAQVAESIYTLSVTAEPISLMQPEESAEDEPIRIYTPPKPDAIDFGGFNVEADVSSLFPDISEDDFETTPDINIDNSVTVGSVRTVQSDINNQPSADKTRVIPAVADDKTRVISSADADKTRVIPATADEKTRVIAPAADDKTRAVDFGAVFERPGIVTTSNAYEKTSDLSALPHILPADEFIEKESKKFVRTGEIPRVSPTPKTPVVRHEEDEQMVLPGFFDKEEIIRVDEDVVEEELKRTRSRKVNSFRLEGAEIDEAVMTDDVSQELTGDNTGNKKRRFSKTKTHHRLIRQRVEFTRPSDGRAVHSFITSKKLMAILGTAVAGICSLILLITTAIPAIADKIDAGSSDIPTTYFISLIGLVIAIAAALPGCITGITCFFNGSGKPNSQTPAIIAAVAALIQNITALSTYNGEKYPLFALAATFLLCCCSFGNILVYSRTGANFAFLFKQGREGLYSARSIDNAADANRVSQNVVMGNADIRYSGKIRFADRFMAYSLSSDSADDLCAKLVPILAGVSLVIAVIGGIITKSFIGAVTVFSGTICMGAPACALIAANLPMLLENKKLREDGAIISGYAAAFEYESTNAVAIDASELFPGENCNIHGMKTFNGVRVDDAVLTAASMLIAAGGPISSLFKNVIMEHNELLLTVEDLKYEERLGLTGWIRNRRVFVGNRKLLENHNIEIPMSIDESKYVGGNRQIIYLADAGKIAAFFVVSYGRNKKIAEYLRQIENNGINILVRTTDSNINEKFIAQCFDLPLNSVKVVSNTAGEVLRNYSEHTIPHEGAKLIHNGTAAAFLHAVSSASRLCAIAGKISTLQTFCMAAGLLLTVLIMIFTGPLSLTALPVCISQFVWLAIAAIIPLFERE